MSKKHDGMWCFMDGGKRGYSSPEEALERAHVPNLYTYECILSLKGKRPKHYHLSRKPQIHATEKDQG